MNSIGMNVVCSNQTFCISNILEKRRGKIRFDNLELSMRCKRKNYQQVCNMHPMNIKKNWKLWHEPKLQHVTRTGSLGWQARLTTGFFKSVLIFVGDLPPSTVPTTSCVEKEKNNDHHHHWSKQRHSKIIHINKTNINLSHSSVYGNQKTQQAVKESKTDELRYQQIFVLTSSQGNAVHMFALGQNHKTVSYNPKKIKKVRHNRNKRTS